MFTKWDKRFIEMARYVATWSSCVRPNRRVGAVIAKEKHILTLGYNGAPAGVKSCLERGECIRVKMNIPSGTRQEISYCLHAEQAAIMQCVKYGTSAAGATLYCTHSPCSVCAKLIVNAGILRVVYDDYYPDALGEEILKEAGVVLEKYDEKKVKI